MSQYIFDRYFDWFKYFTWAYHLLLVPVLAPDYKQHILSPAEIIKSCYSLAVEFCLYKFIRVKGGSKFMEHIKGGAAYKSLETCGLTVVENLAYLLLLSPRSLLPLAGSDVTSHIHQVHLPVGCAGGNSRLSAVRDHSVG
jgi:hypothetical protein